MEVSIRRAFILVVVPVLLVVASQGCVSPIPDDEGAVVVFAASSLSEVFGQIESAFEAENAGVDVRLNFAGSASLREQVLEGAPADVFASANVSNMTRLAESGHLVDGSRVFARNQLIIAVPAGNPAFIETLADFGNDSLLLGLCDVSVPCGDFARQALTKAAVVPRIDTNESDARGLLTKIGADELDAGIVYRTDVIAADGRVDGIRIPDHFNVTADYQIGLLSDAPHLDAAQRFVDFVVSHDGQQILAEYGFDADVEPGAAVGS